MAARHGAAAALLLAGALSACAADDTSTSGAAPSRAPTAAPTASPAAPAPPPEQVPALSPDPSSVEVLATGLRVPWGLDFLPGGDALITERDTARVLRLPAAGGAPQEVTRIAQAEPRGEGGLLGLAVDAQSVVYVYVTTARDNRVVRFPLDDPSSVEPVVTGIPKAGNHNGGRIAFGPDGALYVGTGDAGEPDAAPDTGSLAGKVLRVVPGQPPAVFTAGHRNVQGLAFDGAGRLWATEFGQNRFDEVNLLTAGGDYGWPAVEGAGDGGGRFVAPHVTWSTDEASPSGAAVAGDSLWVAALRGQRLWRVPLDPAGGLGEPEPLLRGEFGRLRTVGRAPDGSLWVLTSNRDGRGDPGADDDRVLRLPPR